MNKRLSAKIFYLLNQKNLLQNLSNPRYTAISKNNFRTSSHAHKNDFDESLQTVDTIKTNMPSPT